MKGWTMSDKNNVDVLENNALVEKQIELEKRGKSLGALRFDTRMDKALDRGRGDETSFGSKVIAQNISELAAVIKTAMTARKAYRVPAVLKLMEEVDPQVVAMITLAGAIRASFNNESLTNTSVGIANNIYHEKLKCNLGDTGKKHFSSILKKSGAQGLEAVKVLEYVSTEHKVVIVPWTQEQKVGVGRLLLEITLQVTGLFEIVVGERIGKDKRPDTLTSSDKLAEQIKTHNNEVRLLSPVYLPMVVKPRPWRKETIYNGCYLTNEQAPVPFVKRNLPKQMALLNQQNPELVFQAVNSAQSTAWRIRKPVLALLKTIIKEEIELGLPISSMPPLKAFSIDQDAPFYIQKELKQKTQEFKNLRNLVEVNLTTAEEFSEFERFYVPHQVDTRGRVYPITAINPQGADYIKGLMEFSDGKKIGREGIYWLKVHTANLFGVDKVSFEERVQWVEQNMSALLASACQPLEFKFWTTADKPIQAFAACLELQGVSEQGEYYCSRMPIALDGSCSGLQHLGAAFNCEVTAKAVNLVDGETPNDIYQDVADKVQYQLEADANTNLVASQWLSFCEHRVSRNITKRPVMTFPYGSKAPGFTQQLLKDTLKPAMQKNPDSFPWQVRRFIEEQDGNRVEVDKFDMDKKEAEEKGLQLVTVDEVMVAAQYMARLIEQAVAETVYKAAAAMGWMQKMASAIALKGEPIYWTSPLGFPVVQDYRKVQSRQIDTVYLGRRLRSRFNKETDKIDGRKMVNAIAPNVVHSLDSSHLMLTVLKGAQEGITEFALIHDSFGTYAADTQRFFSIIREAFVEQYQQDVFKQLELEFKAQVDEELMQAKRKTLPDLPRKGSYQLDSILRSNFAFA